MEQSTMEFNSLGYKSATGAKIANPILVNRQINELRRVMRRMKSAGDTDVTPYVLAKLAEAEKSS